MQSTDGLGNTTTHEFDSRSNRTAVIDAAGVRHESTYAPDDRVESTTLAAGTADALSWTRQRDQFRRIVRVVGPHGTVIEIHRDSLGRPARIDPVGGSGALDVTYDAAGTCHRVVGR